ncbi:hypothetical protein cyc_03100 [Cyclospora cayetanensis]|uniref:Transmembrane protein n=1 Tax=Cyclospora cayetanensis TaxID=88456 RepID=A0A1D3D465_9EIME|nr:hypothetical protein cyc_03100 [Cyclospora cayetanensis]
MRHPGPYLLLVTAGVLLSASAVFSADDSLTGDAFRVEKVSGKPAPTPPLEVPPPADSQDASIGSEASETLDSSTGVMSRLRSLVPTFDTTWLAEDIRDIAAALNETMHNPLFLFGADGESMNSIVTKAGQQESPPPKGPPVFPRLASLGHLWTLSSGINPLDSASKHAPSLQQKENVATQKRPVLVDDDEEVEWRKWGPDDENFMSPPPASWFLASVPFRCVLPIFVWLTKLDPPCRRLLALSEAAARADTPARIV